MVDVVQTIGRIQRAAISDIMKTFLSLILSTVCLLPRASGHGRLLEPPSRSSMWRLGYDTPKNYDDNQLFCGGVGVQYSLEVGGKCGVCGDPWNGPRENEAGGKYANGIIVRKYDKGQVINISIELTANHKGYFEFRLCPAESPFDKVEQECLDKHLLQVASTGETRYKVSGEGYNKMKFRLQLRLPRDLACRACLLQWKYNAGNSWGIGPDGNGCIGCGNQEQFYGCSDVAVGYDDVVVGKPVGTNPWMHKEEGSGWELETHNNHNETDGNRGSRQYLNPVDFCLIVLFLTVFMLL